MRLGPRRAVHALLAMLPILVVVTACSVEHRLDRETLEAEVRAGLFPDHPDLVSAVSCPELLDPAPGRQFACAAQVGDQIIDVPVALGGTADALEAIVALDDRFVEAGRVADLLGEAFTTEIGISTAVDCGQPIVVLDPGQELSCTAVDTSGVNRRFDVIVADDGTLSFEIR